MKTCISLFLTIIAFVSVAVAQDKKAKIEIGVQTTSLTLFHPDVPFDDTQAGIGGRFTFNFNRSIAADAEVNFFPQKQIVFTANGSAIQAQFGVKIGKRFEKFGIFGKLRPGFLSVNSVGSLLRNPEIAADVIVTPCARHRISFDLSVFDVMDGLSLVALRVEFQRDCACRRCVRCFR